MKNTDRSKRLRAYHAAMWDEPIIMEMGSPGERGILVPEAEPGVKEFVGDPSGLIPTGLRRKKSPALPELGQMQVLRHYLRLSQETIGADLAIDFGQGTCTMKYSPKAHETFVRNHKLAELHPYQDDRTLQGILELTHSLESYLKELSGMDKFSFQAGSGSQAIYANAAVIRAYHREKGENSRDEVITTILSHPGNAGAASTAGYKVITLMPDESGLPDLEALKASVSGKTAALFITNPEDTGIFNERIREYTDLVHSAGGLCCYDHANANGLMGIVRARDMGFDLCHYNLHKSFSSPHGSHGPGAGAQGVVDKLAKFLPLPTVEFDGEKYFLDYNRPDSIGKLRKFHGVPPVFVRAYAFIRSLGADGLKMAALLSILNNNYLLAKLLDIPGLSCPMGEGRQRIEQARLSWIDLKDKTGVGTDDINRRILDYGLQTYFTSHHPRIIPEPFTPEPPESYSKDDLDEYAAIIRQVAGEACNNPDLVLNAPHNCPIGQIDPDPLVNAEKFASTWRAYRKNQGKPKN
ncbi:MAG: aminomethyl-transferring glycine dehydrogenase subunit GcvPB [Bacillota bacterium]|nr:aminomethyl-transferring glycine dehydrogenase subunit GcvPB [Bacillota bacterium]